MKRFTYRPNDRLTIEFEAGSDKEAWKELASIDETYGVGHCGKCQSKAIKFILRSNAKKHLFPELRCSDCGFKLAFGQNLEGGTIFPRRRYHEKHPLVKSGAAQDGQYIPNDGWEKFQPKSDDE